MTTHIFGDDAGQGQVMKSSHISGLSPALVTGIRNNPAIARHVCSDGARLRAGQKVGPQVKAQTRKVPRLIHVWLGQRESHAHGKHLRHGLKIQSQVQECIQGLRSAQSLPYPAGQGRRIKTKGEIIQ